MKIRIKAPPPWIRGKAHSMYRDQSLSVLVDRELEAKLQADSKVYLVRASAIKAALGDKTSAALSWQAHCDRIGIKSSEFVSLPVKCAEEIKA